MKKFLFSIGFVFTALFLFSIEIRMTTAYATNDTVLDVAVKYITQVDADNYNSLSSTYLNRYGVSIQSGDYAVSLTIEGNTGFAATGYQIYYDNTICEPLKYYDSSGSLYRPIYCRGQLAVENGLGFNVNLNENEGLLAEGTVHGSDVIGDGIIITFFVRPINAPNGLTFANQKKIITNHGAVHWLDHNTHPIAHTETDGFTLYRYVSSYQGNTWIIGDINNDGVVSLDDAQLILGLYSHYDLMGEVISVTEYVGTYELNTLNHDEVDAVFVITVCDVNSDGVVDVADSMLVLSYYSTYVLGNGNLSDYTGIIGTNVGLFVEYYISLP